MGQHGRGRATMGETASRHPSHGEALHEWTMTADPFREGHGATRNGFSTKL
jgi:hypothetical protein